MVIGVASLVAILSLGDGLEQFSRGQIQQTTDVQFISVDSRLVDRVGGVLVRRPDAVVLSGADADAVAGALGARADVALSLTGSAYARIAGDTARHAVLVTASTPGSLTRFGQVVGAGRDLAAADTAWRGTAPAVVGPGLAGVPGGRIQLDTAWYRVVGVLRDSAGAARVHIPLESRSRARLGENGRSAPTLMIRARRVEDVDAVRKDVEAWLAARYGPIDRAFRVSSNTSRAAQVRQGILVFKLVMGSITGISILVGGIGIMNILLASVAERTREIGIRRAAGARQRDVLLQFLSESIAISAFGSLLGVVLGLAGAFGVSALIRRFTAARIQAGFSWSTIAVAAVMAVVVGVAFGTYPARRAARLSPIEAIRHE